MIQLTERQIIQQNTAENIANALALVLDADSDINLQPTSAAYILAAAAALNVLLALDLEHRRPDDEPPPANGRKKPMRRKPKNARAARTACPECGKKVRFLKAHMTRKHPAAASSAATE